MDDSILKTVKDVVGDTFSDTDDAFDSELITHINTVFVILHRMGVGPKQIFAITGETETWDDFSTEEYTQAVRSYLPLKVKQTLFDPATSSAVKEAVNEPLKELEYTLYTYAEGYFEEEETDANE